MCEQLIEEIFGENLSSECVICNAIAVRRGVVCLAVAIDEGLAIKWNCERAAVDVNSPERP